jgi:hypothetical protein
MTEAMNSIRMKGDYVMPEDPTTTLRDEIDALFHCMTRGDTQASVHLARVIQTDTQGALQPFAEALAARLCDHLNRYAESGETNPYHTLRDEVYMLIKMAAVDWDDLPKTGRPGEEA